MNPYDGPYELPRHIMQMVEDGAPDFLFMDADDRFEAWANRPVKQATFIDHNIEKQSKISAMQRVAQVAQAKPAGPKTGIKSVKTDRRGQCWNSRTGRWESLIQPLHGSVAIMAKLLILPLDQDMKVIARGKTSLAPGATVNEIADKVGYAAGRCGKKVAFVWVTTEDQPDRPSLAEWHLVNDKLICVSPPMTVPAVEPEPENAVDITNGKEADMAKKNGKAKAPRKPRAEGNGEKKRSRRDVTIEALRKGVTVPELAAMYKAEFGDGKESTAKLALSKVPRELGRETKKVKDNDRGTVYRWT